MTLLIRPEHREIFSGVIEKMFRLRRRVFIERLRWPLEGGTEDLEFDEFDQGECYYLVNLDSRGDVLASMRLTPTLQPNVSCTALQSFFKVEFPRGAHIAEGSRLCVDPDLSHRDRDAAILDLESAAYELAGKMGWSHGIGCATETIITHMVRVGLPVKIIDGPVMFPPGDEMSFAIVSEPDSSKTWTAWLRSGALEACLEDPLDDPDCFERYGRREQAA